MKGDFENFIDQNPKIFEKKNPRIQVTRATCDLSNIIENGNNDMNNNNKVLSNIVQKCDYDLYANQKSKSKKDKWYSMSIPLNQLKQVPDYKKQNKNEMTEKNEKHESMTLNINVKEKESKINSYFILYSQGKNQIKNHKSRNNKK